MVSLSKMASFIGKPDRRPADPLSAATRREEFRHDLSGHRCRCAKALQLSPERAGDRAGSTRVGASRPVVAVENRPAPILVLPKDEAAGPMRWVLGRASGVHLAGSGAALFRDAAGLAARVPTLREISGKPGTTSADSLRHDGSGAGLPGRSGNVLIGTHAAGEQRRAQPDRFKTGTSYGISAMPGRLVLTVASPLGSGSGVPYGAPVRVLSAAPPPPPILFDAFAPTPENCPCFAKPPKGTLMASNAKLPLAAAPVQPGRGNWFRTVQLNRRRAIQFPLNGSRNRRRSIRAGSSFPPCGQGSQAACLPMTMLCEWRIGGGDRRPAAKRLVDPPGPGFARLTVNRRHGAADTVVIRIQ